MHAIISEFTVHVINYIFDIISSIYNKWIFSISIFSNFLQKWQGLLEILVCLDLFTRINVLFAKGGTMTHLQTKFFILSTMEWCIAQFPTIQRMSFIDLQCLFTPLVSSNFSYSTVRCVSILKWTNQLLIMIIFVNFHVKWWMHDKWLFEKLT